MRMFRHGLLRTSFMLTSLAMAAGQALAQAPPPNSSPPTKRFVRQSLYDFVQDRNKLISLVRAVDVMRSRNTAPKDSAEYRTSWEYWANIHGYTGAGKNAGETRNGVRLRTAKDVRDSYEKEVPQLAAALSGFFAGLKDFTPPDQLAEDIWGTCEHGTPQFFAWHRMYLYFFERVMREASGDPDFALPYWDYTNNTTIRNAQGQLEPTQPWRIPFVFVVPELPDGAGNPVPNPLFEPRRTGGFGITVHVNLEVTNIDPVLRRDKFFDPRPGGDQGFQMTLDNGLHGLIHCLSGNACRAPFMGLTPFSANDPVFYHHHANIDRLWSCWTNRWGKDANPIQNEDWMKQEYTFVDEKGDRKTMSVRELFNPNGRIDYTYDHESDCSREKVAQPLIAMTSENTSRLSATGLTFDIATAKDVRIDKADQRVPLTLPQAESGARSRAFTNSLRPTVLTLNKALLRVSNVTAGSLSGASVAVYLENAKTQRRAFVGVLSFFNPSAHEHGDGGQADGRSYAFDVSAQLQQLFADSPTSDGLEVALVPVNHLPAELSRDANLYESAGIRIGEIKLEVESQSRGPAAP